MEFRAKGGGLKDALFAGVWLASVTAAFIYFPIKILIDARAKRVGWVTLGVIAATNSLLQIGFGLVLFLGLGKI